MMSRASTRTAKQIQIDSLDPSISGLHRQRARLDEEQKKMHATSDHTRDATFSTDSPKETAAAYFNRELTESLQQMAITSNRLSAAKKRLQDHFGMPTTDSASMSDPKPPYSGGMDGTRAMLNDLALRLESIASGMEELI